jgi:hypothetical protein
MSTDPQSPEVRTQVAKDTQKEVSIVDRTVQTLMNNTPLTGLGGGTFGLGGFVPQELIPENVQLTGEEGIFEKTGDILYSPMGGLFRALNEFARPQKALFAAGKALQDGEGFSDALGTGVDEFLSGFGSGEYKRDVFFSDIMFPNTETEDLVWWQSGAGLVGDIVLDPINIPGASKLPRIAVDWLGDVGRKGISIAEGIAPQAVKDSSDKIVGLWRDAFIVPDPVGDAARAVEYNQRRLHSYSEIYRGHAVKGYKADNKVVKKTAKELGMDQNELADTIGQHAEYTKLEDPELGLPEPLNNTMERIYNEQGIEGYNRFYETSGRRDIVDQRPLRRQILDNKFDMAEEELIDTIGPQGAEKVKDLIFELKERNLERIHEEITERVIRDPDSPRFQLFESMEKDYMTIIANKQFKQAAWNLLGARRGSRLGGFEFNPSHTSELHSTLQPIGARKANDLLRTPRYKGSPESKFYLKDPDTGDRLYMPVMDKGFNEDPFYADWVRTYYSKLAIEQSQVMDELGTAFGRTLGDTMEITKFDPKLGKNVTKVINTFTDPVRIVDEDSVTDLPGKIVAKPGREPAVTVASRKLSREASKELERQGLKMVKGIKGFENLALPAEGADLINRVTAQAKDPTTMTEVGRVLNKIQNEVWKPWTLFVYPEFHSRNVVSNLFLMNVGGMPWRDMPKYLAKGVAVLSAGSPNATRQRLAKVIEMAGVDGKKLSNFVSSPALADQGGSLASKSIKLDDLIRGVDFEDISDKDALSFLQLVVDLGVVRAGEFGTAEIARSLEGGLNYVKKSTTRKIVGGLPFLSTPDNSALLRAGMGMGGAIEDSMRLGFFMWSLEKGGMDVMAGRKHVFKHMIDFNRLTDTEQRIMKGVFMPFYSWARQFHEGQVADERLQPEYVRRGASIPTRRAPDGSYQYFIMDDWIPGAQLAKMDTVDELMAFLPAQTASPIIRTFAELAFKKSYFLDAEWGRGKTEFAGLRMHPATATILRNARILGIVDRFTRSNRPSVQANLIRLLTGFNQVRVSEQQMLSGWEARHREILEESAGAVGRAVTAFSENKITEDEMNEEIRLLIKDYQRFIETGRE